MAASYGLKMKGTGNPQSLSGAFVVWILTVVGSKTITFPQSACNAAGVLT